MQTFVTSTDENPVMAAILTAENLDSKRLGKQRVEAKQIWTALVDNVGWIHHPATKMWSGHTHALAIYGHAMCSVWIKRGFDDSLRPWFRERCEEIEWPNKPKWPWWFGNAQMVQSHRSNLVHKLPQHYGPLFPEVAELPRMPYLWPNPLVPQEFSLSKAEAKRGDWTMPDDWKVS